MKILSIMAAIIVIFSVLNYFSILDTKTDIQILTAQLNTIQIQTAQQYCETYDVPEIVRNPKLIGKVKK